MKNFIKKHSVLLFFELLIITVFVEFYGQFGSFAVDSFREAYIAKEVFTGKVLYKDIFCVYAPLSYMINGFLFFVFKPCLTVLYLSGLFSTMTIFGLIYEIARKFFDKFLIFGILAIVFSSLVMSSNVFNSFFPYSYGELYGIVFILASLLCALNKKFACAYLFYSLSICCKYDFVFFLPCLMFYQYKTELINLKKFVTEILLPLFLFPVILLIILLFQGLGISDIVNTLDIIKNIGTSETLNNFYFTGGLVPNLGHIPVYLFGILTFLFPFLLIFGQPYQTILVYLFPLLILGLIIRHKSLDLTEKFLIISSVAISIKVFFALAIRSYGVYYMPLALISLGILLKQNKVSGNQISLFQKILAVYLIIWSLIVGYFSVNDLKSKNIEVKSPYGICKTKNPAYKNIIDFAQNTPLNSKILIFPEGPFVNFLANREGNPKLYSLIPLYIEVFKEDYVINQINNSMPDYIIIDKLDTSEYGYKYFGVNYALKIADYIKKNYTPTGTVDSKFTIYKKK